MHTQLTHVPPALVPGPVQNLKRVIDPKLASVKLSWDPPLNFKRPGEVTAYRISFQPKGRNESDELIIDKSSTSYLLTRDLGLKASTMHTFAVRAENAETPGELKKVTAYVGKFVYSQSGDKFEYVRKPL